MLVKEAQTITIVEGEYNSTEAKDQICSLINAQIRTQNNAQLQSWENNHNDPCNNAESEVKRLIEERNELLQILETAKKEGKKVQIRTVLEVQIAD